MATRVQSLRGRPLTINQQNRKRRRDLIRPTNGMRADRSFMQGETWLDSRATFAPDHSALFRTTPIFEFGNEGYIFSAGVGNTGAVCAVLSDRLIIRAGVTNQPPNNDVARLSIGLNELPRNRRVRLVWAYLPSETGPMRVLCWVDGKYVAGGISRNPVLSWTNTGPGGFNIASNLVTEASSVSQPYMTDGEIVNELFYYRDFASEIQPIQETIVPVTDVNTSLFTGHIQTDRFAATDAAGLTKTAIVDGTTSYQFMLEGNQENDYLAIVFPSRFRAVSLINNAIGMDALAPPTAFSVISGAVEINDIPITSLLFGPLNPDLIFDFTLNLATA